MQMTRVSQVQSDYFERQQDQNRETRLKIKRGIPKIQCETPTGLILEYDAFEEAIYRFNPKGYKDWALALDDSLENNALSCRDYVILTEPGKSMYEKLRRPDAVEEDYLNYYRYIRGKLFERVGLRYENPGEFTRLRWKET